MDALQEKVLARFDEQELVQMMVDCVKIPSPTGREHNFAEFLAEKFATLGMRTQLQEVEPGRPNVIASLRGSGGGARMMLCGHTDHRYEPPPWNGEFFGEWLAGGGAANMKPMFPIAYMATRMLLEAGVDLKGDLLIAGVVGECEKAPVDKYQGPEYRGSGHGARYLVTHGVTADLCTIAEPSALRIQCANTGYIFIKLSTEGEVTNTAYSHLAENALEKMLTVIQAVKDYTPIYAERHRRPKYKPTIAISAIEGGFPYSPARSPAPFCHLYMKIPLSHGESVQDIHVELRAMLDELKKKDAKLDVDMEFFCVSNGYEISEEEYLPQAFRRAHVAVLGQEPEPVNPERYLVSSDNSPFFEYGIRGIVYGASGFSRLGPAKYAGYDKELQEVVNINRLKDCTKVYALALLDIMTQPRDLVLARP